MANQQLATLWYITPWHNNYIFLPSNIIKHCMLFLSACQSTLNHIEPMDHRLAPRRVIGDHKNCRDFWVVNKSAKVMTSSSVKNFTIHHAYPRNSTDRLLSVSDDPPGPRLTKSLKKTWHWDALGISVVSMVLRNVSFWWRISMDFLQWFTKGWSPASGPLRPTPRATTTSKNPTRMPWKCYGKMMFVAKIAMMRSYDIIWVCLKKG